MWRAVVVIGYRKDEPLIAAVVLAAGRSSRMGKQKLLLPLGDRPIIAHAVTTVLATSLHPCVVVVGRDAARVRGALPPGELIVVHNSAFAAGLSTSLRAGIAALPNGPDAAQPPNGVIVLLGDQPLLTTAQLNRLIDTAERSSAPIVAASYGGRRGNPVYFARSFFPELAAIQGDEGARGVIARHADQVALCEMGGEHADLDIDTPTDYGHAQALWASRQAPGEP